jgi:hypothetical protein
MWPIAEKTGDEGMSDAVAHRHVVGAAQYFDGDDAVLGKPSDCHVSDEPLYAAWLKLSGAASGQGRGDRRR